MTVPSSRALLAAVLRAAPAAIPSPVSLRPALVSPPPSCCLRVLAAGPFATPLPHTLRRGDHCLRVTGVTGRPDFPSTLSVRVPETPPAPGKAERWALVPVAPRGQEPGGQRWWGMRAPAPAGWG